MVNVIGLGYIGLPTALMMASHGVEVVGTDYNKELVEILKAGKLTFEEKGLEELFNNAIGGGIKFSHEYMVCDTYIVSVPTPYNKIDKKINAEYVVNAVKSVLEVCEDGATIVIESTISPGTIDKYVRPLVKDDSIAYNKKINLVHAPERIIPGNMVYELEHNNRTIGADDIEVGNKIKELYASFCKGEIVVTDIKTAEMSKVIENTYRAVNIAFANELTKICYQNDMDVHEIIKICNMHPRVNILSPGPGVGGHCIPVDPWFLVGDYPTLTNVIYESMKVNAGMPEFVMQQIYNVIQENGIDDVNQVGLYGLSYKENVDDYRESPTLQLLDIQKRHLGQPLKTYDPYIKKSIVENQMFDFDEFVDSVKVIVIMVGHNEILEKMSKLEDKIVIDTRNIVKDGMVKNLYRLGYKKKI